jgi:hypothetical protein
MLLRLWRRQEKLAIAAGFEPVRTGSDRFRLHWFVLSLAHWTSLAFPDCNVPIPPWLLPPDSFERVVINSARGTHGEVATASFLNGEIVFHGIALRPRVVSEKSAKTSDNSEETRAKSAGEEFPEVTISGRNSRTQFPDVRCPGNRHPGNPKKRIRACRGRKADPNVVKFSDAFIASHGRAPTGREIRTQFPDMPRQTAHDYAARAVDIGKGANITDDAFARVHPAGRA